MALSIRGLHRIKPPDYSSTGFRTEPFATWIFRKEAGEPWIELRQILPNKKLEQKRPAAYARVSSQKIDLWAMGLDSHFTQELQQSMRIFQLALFIVGSVSASAFSIDELEAPGYRASYPDQVIEANQISIAPARSRKGHFSYGETNASVNATVYSNENTTQSILAGFRRIHQSLGSKIASKNTLYGVVGVNSEYTGVEEWLWSGGLVIQPDMRFSHCTRSIRYIPSLHGRYQVAPTAGLHVGMYAELGMRSSIVRPLIGVDYTWKKWLFQAIFPIKYGISFQGVTNHVFSFMVRPFYTAVFVRRGLTHRPAITCYKGTGAELRWDYFPTSRWNLWLAVGSTLQGSLTIGDTNNNHRHHVRLHRAPYWTLGITWGFTHHS